VGRKGVTNDAGTSAANSAPDGVDAVVVGSGPNGLAAAVALARDGFSVTVLEGDGEIGGGTRTRELTLPGFHHDVCSACHPIGAVSPFFRSLDLGAHGLEFLTSDVSVAHPLDDGPAVLLSTSLEETARGLAGDARAYEGLFAPFLRDPHGLFADILAPFAIPKHPLLMARFGLIGLRSAVGVAKGRFDGERARALFSGCAAHSVLPLERAISAAVGLVFCLSAHVTPWPIAKGGSIAIARALASMLKAHGGTIETGRWVKSLADLPPARVYLFDTSPRALAEVAEPVLPSGYVARLRRYRYGPGAFKIDWALDGPIPWRDPDIARAPTVHVGGTIEEVAAGEAAVWRGEHPDKPFLLLCQQSALDDTRAPAGKHTGYAYCHVPAGSTKDMTESIERQVERFAPGFRDSILARATMSTADFERHNPSLVGGAITGGVADIAQLFTRPVARWNPYTTPNPRVFLCSSSTPPGGGVHGMCGYYAARAAKKKIARFKPAPLR
jgi:phytoene dehydrogenase-like protein